LKSLFGLFGLWRKKKKARRTQAPPATRAVVIAVVVVVVIFLSDICLNFQPLTGIARPF
jgi:hypothetical protein